MTKCIPLADIESRPPEAGRIRLGEKVDGISKAGKKYTRPASTETFRFTSPEKEQIEAIAGIYGGDVQAWNEPRATIQHQWEVKTPVDRISVWLPPDALSVSYEAWSGGGCIRRCDGVTCMMKEPAMGIREVVPCLCGQEPDDSLCKPKSRLSVVLPGIPFSGVWRMETSSEYFVYEARGMIDTIAGLEAAQGVLQVDLVLSKRTKRDGGQVSHYIVPQIALKSSPSEILEGLARVGQGTPQLALDPGWTETKVLDPIWHSPAPDDEITDAEIIEEPAYDPGGWDTPPPGELVMRNPDSNGPKWIRKPTN